MLGYTLVALSPSMNATTVQIMPSHPSDDARPRTTGAGPAGRYDCWRNDSERPAGLHPTRALVTPDGSDRPEVVHADVGYRIWLDNEPGTLHAFCR